MGVKFFTILSVVSILQVFLVYLIAAIYKHFHYKFLEKTQFKINGAQISYNGKQIKVNVKEESLSGDRHLFGRVVLYTYYINDKPAMYLYKLERDVYSNFGIAFNPKYDCSEVFKILRAGRKQFSKDLSIKVEEKCQKEKLY